MAYARGSRGTVRFGAKRPHRESKGRGKGTVIAFGTYPLVVRCPLFFAHANLHA